MDNIFIKKIAQKIQEPKTVIKIIIEKKKKQKQKQKQNKTKQTNKQNKTGEKRNK